MGNDFSYLVTLRGIFRRLLVWGGKLLGVQDEPSFGCRRGTDRAHPWSCLKLPGCKRLHLTFSPSQAARSSGRAKTQIQSRLVGADAGWLRTPGELQPSQGAQTAPHSHGLVGGRVRRGSSSPASPWRRSVRPSSPRLLPNARGDHRGLRQIRLQIQKNCVRNVPSMRNQFARFFCLWARLCNTQPRIPHITAGTTMMTK